MLYCVLYYDYGIPGDDLQEYVVEANSSDEAEELFEKFANGDEDLEIYSIGVCEKNGK